MVRYGHFADEAFYEGIGFPDFTDKSYFLILNMLLKQKKTRPLTGFFHDGIPSI